MSVNNHFVTQFGANASELVSSSSAYENQVTIQTLVQSETIGKSKIPSFLCKSSLGRSNKNS